MKPLSIRLRPGRAPRDAKGRRSTPKPAVLTIDATHGARERRISHDSMRRQVELAASRGLPQGARARSVIQDRLVNGTAPDQDNAVMLRRGATE